MQTIQVYLESKQQEFVTHPFFESLAAVKSLEEFYSFLPALTFWPMVFQDVLRINENQVSDPYLKKVARHHRQEDAGHENWFLSDVKYICQLQGIDFDKHYNAREIFSDNYLPTREACYKITSEVFHAKEDILRTILLLALESSGHIFFEKSAELAIKIGSNDKLKYFSSFHLDVELAHELFEGSMEDEFYNINLNETQRREALLMIDRVYDAFNQLLDSLFSQMSIAKEAKIAHNDKSYTVAHNNASTS